MLMEVKSKLAGNIPHNLPVKPREQLCVRSVSRLNKTDSPNSFSLSFLFYILIEGSGSAA